MLSKDMHRKRLIELKKEEAALKKKKADEARAVSKLRREMGRLEHGTSKTSESSRKQKSRQIEQKYKKVTASEAKIAKYDADIAKNLKDQRQAQNQLDGAVYRKTRKEDAKAKKRRGEEMSHAKALTRESKRQNRFHSNRLSEEHLKALPPKIKVLFFAANPLDQTQLRLDEEIREVTRQIRLSEHRELCRAGPPFGSEERGPFPSPQRA